MDDTQWLEATQAMNDDIQDEEKDEKMLMAWLEVAGHRHEVFTGETKIGRDPSSCEIVLDSKTLSKKHAVLEIDGETHLIADLNSMNKTRIGKAYLKPNVRYALQGGENLKFGDVHALYIIKSQMISDSDSETGSESFLEPTQPMPPSPPSPRSAWSPVMSQSLCADLEEEEDDSFISPTPVPTVPSNATTLLFQGSKHSAYIPETPTNDRLHGPGMGTSIIPESPTPSECTPINSKTRQAFVLETPADNVQSPHSSPLANNQFNSGNTTITKNFQDMSHMTDEDDDSFFLEPSQQSKKSSIFSNKSKFEPPSKDQDDDTGDYNSDDSTDVESIDGKIDEKIDLIRNEGDKILHNTNSGIGKTNDKLDNIKNTEIRNISDEDLVATQVFSNADKNINQSTNRFKDTKKISDDIGEDIDSESDDDIATQMFDAEFAIPNRQILQKSISSNKKINSTNEIKDDFFDNPTQLFSASKSESLNVSKQGSFLLPKEADTTQDIMDAFDDDDNNLPTPLSLREKQQSKVRDKLDDDDDINTQMFDDHDKEISFKKPSIIPNRRNSLQEKSIDEKDDDFFFAPTQQFNEDLDKPKQERPSSMLNSPARVFSEDQLAPTQQFSGTTITKPFHSGRDGTVCDDDNDDDDIDEALFDEPTQSFVSNISKTAEKFEEDMLAPTQVFKTPSLIVRKASVFKAQDDDNIPTQLFDDDELPPTQVFKVPSTNVSRILEAKEDDDDDDELPLTQVFKVPSTKVSRILEAKEDDEDEDDDDDELPPSQVFKVPSTKVNRVVEVSENDDDSTQIFDECNEDLLPTQAFKDSPKRVKLSATVIDDEDIPTQAFDDVDAVPTQAFKRTPSKTAIVKENAEYEEKISNQLFSKSPSKIVGNEDDDVPTQVFQTSPRITTGPDDMDPTQVFTNSPRITTGTCDMDPTQVFSKSPRITTGPGDMDPTQVFPNSPRIETGTCDMDPTQVFSKSPRITTGPGDMDPTQEFPNSPRITGCLGDDLIPTQLFSRNLSKENEDCEDVATQVFPKSPSKDFKRCGDKNDVSTEIKENEDCEEDIATQVFHKSPSKDNMKSNDRKYIENQSKENEDMEDIPTQVFPVSPCKDVHDEEDMPTQVFSKTNSDNLIKDTDSPLKGRVDEDDECTQDIGIDIPVGVAQTDVPRKTEIINKFITSNQQNVRNTVVDDEDVVVDNDDDENSNASETLLADQEELVSQTKDHKLKNLEEAENYGSDESTDIEEFEVIPKTKTATRGDQNLVKSTKKSNNETLKLIEGSEKENANVSSLKLDSENIDLKDLEKNKLSPDKANQSNISRLEISTDSDITLSAKGNETSKANQSNISRLEISTDSDVTQSAKGNETSNISHLELSSDSNLPECEEAVAGSSKTLQIADSSMNKTESKKLHTPNFLRIIKPVDNILSSVSSMNDFVQSSESTQGSVAGLGDISLSNIIFADSEEVTEDVTTQDMLDESVYKVKSVGVEHLKTPPKKSHILLEDTESESDDDQLSSSLRLFDIPPEELKESPQQSPMKARSHKKSPRKLVSPNKKTKDSSEDSTSGDEESDRVTIASPVRRRSRRERNNDKGMASKSTDEEVEIEHKVDNKNIARKGKKNKSEIKDSFVDDDTGHSEVEIEHKVENKNIARKGKKNKSEVKHSFVDDDTDHSSKNLDQSKKDDDLELRKGRSGARKGKEESLESETSQFKNKKSTVKKNIDESDEKKQEVIESKSFQDITERKGRGKKSVQKSNTEDDDKTPNIQAEIKVVTKSGSSSKTSSEKEKNNKSTMKKVEMVPEEGKHTKGKRKKKIFDSDTDSDETDLSDYKGTSSKKRKSHIESPKKKVKGKDVVLETDNVASGKRKNNKRKSTDAELSDEAPSKNMKRPSKRNDQSQNETCVTLDDVNKPPARRGGRRRMSETSSASTVSNSNQRASTRKSLAVIEKTPVRGQGKQLVVHESDSSTSEVSKRGRGRPFAVHDSDASAVEVPKRGRGGKLVAHESDSSASDVTKKKPGRKSCIQDSESNIAEMPKRGQRRPSVAHESDSNTLEVSKKGKGRQSNIHEFVSKKGTGKSSTSKEVDSNVSNDDEIIDEDAEPRRGSRIHRGPQKYSPSKNDKEVAKKEAEKKGRKSDVEKSSKSPVEKSKESLEIKELEKKDKKVGSKKAGRSAVGRKSESEPNSDEDAPEIIAPRMSRGRSSIASSEKNIKTTQKSIEPVSQKSEELSSKNIKKGKNSQEPKTDTKDKKTDTVTKKSGKRQTMEPSASDGSLKRSSSQSSLDSQASQNRKKRSRATEEICSTPKSRTSGSSRGSPYSGDSVLWSPSHRHQLADNRPKVMFTSYTDAGDEKIVSKLGGSVVEDPQECSVLVTTAIRRTCKLIAALGGGRPIVSPKWLAASKQARNFTDPWSYLVVDKEAEKKFEFCLEKTLKTALKNPLFDGYSIYVTKSVKPPPDQMKEIITCSGGEFLESAPKSAHEKVLVVSCEEDKRQWGSFKKNKIPIVSFEFVLTGLLRQKILIEEYRLS